jgi:hypothetical protein
MSINLEARNVELLAAQCISQEDLSTINISFQFGGATDMKREEKL